jgi:hypothetical protein
MVRMIGPERFLFLRAGYSLKLTRAVRHYSAWRGRDMEFDAKAIWRAVDGRQVPGLRRWLVAGAAVQALLLVALYYYIGRHANPMGDGLEWAAFIPALLITATFIIPALLLGVINRLLTVGAALAGIGALLNLAFYFEIAREFASN